MQLTVVDPDLELTRGVGGGFDLRALLAFLPCVVSSFLPKIRGPQAPPVDASVVKFCTLTASNLASE